MPVRSKTTTAANVRVADSITAVRMVLVAPQVVSDQVERQASTEPGLDIVAGTDRVPDVWNLVARTKPDLAVVDADLGDNLAGVAVGRHVQRFLPNIGIVLITGDIDLSLTRPLAVDFGHAWTYVHRQRLTERCELLNALNSMARGIPWLDPKLEEGVRATWEIARHQRDIEDNLLSTSGQRLVPDAGILRVRGYEGARPRSFDQRTRERYDF